MPSTDSNNFNVDLENYQGPLDILLDLAKAQKVDLANISIAKLTEILISLTSHGQGDSQRASCGVRTHAEFPLVDLKSTPLTTRAN